MANVEFIRAHCMQLPHATEQVQWGDDLVFKIGGKMFAGAPLSPARIALSFKCTPEEFAELVERPGVIPAPYAARYFWVALETHDALPPAEIKKRLTRSYELVFAKLPKKTQLALGANPAKRSRAQMIVGTGVDLCEVPRIRKAIEAPYGHRLVERIFTQREIVYARKKANPYERFAARFAAKEAGMKALGTGWRHGIAWRDFEVANLPSGRPTLRMSGKAAEIAQKLGVTNISLSITHTEEQALAMVILESL